MTDDTTTITRQVASARLADGRVLEVETCLPDSIRWEKTAAHRWPELIPDVIGDRYKVKAPLFMQAFIVWAALKRTGAYDGTFEQFSETDCVDIDTRDEPVTPTPPGPSPG